MVANISKEMKFMKAKEPVVATTTVEKVKVEKEKNNQRMLIKPCNQSVVKPEAKGKSIPKSQRVPRTKYFYHHYGL